MKNGELESGFSFHNNGAFIVNYSEENPDWIEILLYRNYAAYVVDERGNILEKKKWKQNTSNSENCKYYDSKNYDVRGSMYQIAHAADFLDGWWEAGSEVIKIDEEGNEKIIYSNISYPFTILMNTVFIVIGFSITIFIMLRVKNSSRKCSVSKRL